MMNCFLLGKREKGQEEKPTTSLARGGTRCWCGLVDKEIPPPLLLISFSGAAFAAITFIHSKSIRLLTSTRTTY